MKDLVSFLTALIATLVTSTSHANFQATNSGPSTLQTSQDALQGEWQKPCVADPEVPEIFTKQVLVIKGTVWAELLQVFGDPSCTGPILGGEAYFFSFIVPNYVPDQNNAVDLIFAQSFLVFNLQESVDLANAKAFCGLTNWQQSVPQDISKTVCSAYAPNQPVYDIFRLSPTLLQTGQIDSNHPGISPETRPMVLEPVPYSR